MKISIFYIQSWEIIMIRKDILYFLLKIVSLKNLEKDMYFKFHQIFLSKFIYNQNLHLKYWNVRL